MLLRKHIDWIEEAKPNTSNGYSLLGFLSSTQPTINYKRSAIAESTASQNATDTPSLNFGRPFS
jgi:hypothetical protein